MQVLGSDMAPADARRRFFGFWRLIGELGGLVSPALFGFAAFPRGPASLYREQENGSDSQDHSWNNQSFQHFFSDLP